MSSKCSSHNAVVVLGSAEQRNGHRASRNVWGCFYGVTVLVCFPASRPWPSAPNKLRGVLERMMLFSFFLSPPPPPSSYASSPPPPPQPPLNLRRLHQFRRLHALLQCSSTTRMCVCVCGDCVCVCVLSHFPLVLLMSRDHRVYVHVCAWTLSTLHCPLLAY